MFSKIRFLFGPIFKGFGRDQNRMFGRTLARSNWVRHISEQYIMETLNGAVITKKFPDDWIDCKKKKKKKN